MPSLSFFIDENDLHLLLARLNADPEIAFIVPDNMRRRRTVSKTINPAPGSLLSAL